MPYKIQTAPTEEPVTLQEAKSQLRLDSYAFEDNVESEQSIAPGSHDVAASYSLKGSGVDVSSAAATVVIFAAGTCGSGGTVDAKLQHSQTDVDGDYEDVDDGAFSQVSEANDQQTYELAYTGTKTYLRVVATVAGAACEFGISVLTKSPAHDEDTLITRKIKAARRDCEKFSGRAYITQTWDLYLDEFPDVDWIELPLPPLQSVTYVKYKDTNGDLQTFDSESYIVDTVREPGRIYLAYGEIWPSTYGEVQSVQIRFVCGYGEAADVPENIKEAVLVHLTDLFVNRGDAAPRGMSESVRSLLWKEDRIWRPC